MTSIPLNHEDPGHVLLPAQQHHRQYRCGSQEHYPAGLDHKGSFPSLWPLGREPVVLSQVGSNRKFREMDVCLRPADEKETSKHPPVPLIPLPAYGSPLLTACVWQSSPHLRSVSGPAAMLTTDKTSGLPLNLCYEARVPGRVLNKELSQVQG